MSKFFKSNGKLLITGEYVVLDGAMALAIPTQKGQSLAIDAISDPIIKWKSFDSNNKLWFHATFRLNDDTKSTLEIIEANNNDMASRLRQILDVVKKSNASFLNSGNGFSIESRLEFPQDWGLGSSSTLINNLSNWAEINPYDLLNKTFGGSGYDIACAESNSSITYQLGAGQKEQPVVNKVDFDPEFKNHLYFIHLNKKQNSRDGISRYKSIGKIDRLTIDEISELTKNIVGCKSLNDFNELIRLHESIISKLIELQPVQERMFSDFEGQIKSLGAWGGDFILASATHDILPYFKSKGYNTIIPYEKMVLNKKALSK